MNMYFIREHNLSLFHLRLRETPDLDLLNEVKETPVVCALVQST